MESRNQIESFVVGAGIKQLSPRARIDCSGTSGVLPRSSWPARRGKLCLWKPCDILAIVVL